MAPIVPECKNWQPDGARRIFLPFLIFGAYFSKKIVWLDFWGNVRGASLATPTLPLPRKSTPWSRSSPFHRSCLHWWEVAECKKKGSELRQSNPQCFRRVALLVSMEKETHKIFLHFVGFGCWLVGGTERGQKNLEAGQSKKWAQSVSTLKKIVLHP
jgi:hypothetical protein